MLIKLFFVLQRYQPVSYKLDSRSGDRNALADMLKRCNAAGVRVYADMVLNHMTGHVGKGTGVDGSTLDSDKKTYPAVPYSYLDFHARSTCPSSSGGIENWNDPVQLRNCEMGGLIDIDNGKKWVRQHQAAVLNELIDMGVAGFRFDASKHIWPKDFAAIFSRLHNLNTQFFAANSRPFMYHEVGEMSAGDAVKNADYSNELGRAIEFRYGDDIADCFRGRNGQRIAYLKNFGEGWGYTASDASVTHISNHDSQRGHRGDITRTITFFEPRLNKLAHAFMLAWPYAVPRIMSSYRWTRDIRDGKDANDWVGPPHDGRTGAINRVVRNADLTCAGGWVCEHRWRQVYQMVAFRNAAGDAPVVNWWDNGNQQIAFARRGRAFIAINNEPFAMKGTFSTSLPAGVYCDVISGVLKDGQCTGFSVRVTDDGSATLMVGNQWQDPMIAIHVNAKL